MPDGSGTGEGAKSSVCQRCHYEIVAREGMEAAGEANKALELDGEYVLPISEIYKAIPEKLSPAQFKEGLIGFISYLYNKSRWYGLDWFGGKGWCFHWEVGRRVGDPRPPGSSGFQVMADLIGIPPSQLVSMSGAARDTSWKGNGGERHSYLAAEALNFLQIYDQAHAHVIAQEPGKSAPDIIHRLYLDPDAWEMGEPVNNEIETTAGNPDQVVRNLEKAQGALVRFWTPNRTVAHRVANTLRGRSGYAIMARNNVQHPDFWGRPVKELLAEFFDIYEEVPLKEGTPSPVISPTLTTPAGPAQSPQDTPPIVQTLTRHDVLKHCELLQRLGKVTDIDGRRAVLLQDLGLAGYPQSSLKDLSLRLQHMPDPLPTSRVWSPTLKKKVTVIFPWG
jgi:hypothetical protein